MSDTVSGTVTPERRENQPAFESAPGIDIVGFFSNPEDPRIVAAMKTGCGICDAKPGRPCWNICDPEGGPLPGRIVHFYRIPAKFQYAHPANKQAAS